MSVKIRLTKTGKKNQIQFRIVVQDTRVKRDGKFLEILGTFDPKSQKHKIAEDRMNFWTARGAKPTPSVSYLLENGALPKRIRRERTDEKPQEQKNQENSTGAKENQSAEKPQESKADKPQEKELSQPEPETTTPNVQTEEKPITQPAS